jgi:hypothetical protein
VNFGQELFNQSAPSIERHEFYISIATSNVKIITKLILIVVLCGGETWSHTRSEENRLRVFGNRVLRGVFGLIGK